MEDQPGYDSANIQIACSVTPVEALRTKWPLAGFQLAVAGLSVAVKPFCNSQAVRRSQRLMLQAAAMK